MPLGFFGRFSKTIKSAENLLTDSSISAILIVKLKLAEFYTLGGALWNILAVIWKNKF